MKMRCEECERVVNGYLSYPENFHDAMVVIAELAEHAKVHADELKQLGHARIHEHYVKLGRA